MAARCLSVNIAPLGNKHQQQPCDSPPPDPPPLPPPPSTSIFLFHSQLAKVATRLVGRLRRFPMHLVK